MFGGAYDDAPAHIRPVYGGLNFRHKVVGAAPRFRSAHLRLTAASLARATFRLDRGVEALVLDPSYRGTGVEAAARRLPCQLEWHPGFSDLVSRAPPTP